ncbi:MAG TPA: single-stranded DNA-binding protein [Firmicutes bacterium]|jgi:single-strand DNA-binding protein|nr:single-stranded DNA-binding protein [Bacillota bacterium]
MLNRVILIGRLTRDPELKYTSTGRAVSTFILAVDRNFTNQQGEREADFIPIVTWNKLAETVAHNLVKGRLVAVEGRLRVRSYEAKDGERRWVTEVNADLVQFLEPKSKYTSDNDDDNIDSLNDEGYGSGGDIDSDLQEVPF